MTAKEQGLLELADEIETVTIRHPIINRTQIAISPLTVAGWCDRIRTLAALASDTGERGVVDVAAIDRMLAAYAKVGGPVDGQLHTRHEIDLARQALAALRAHPAGGGEWHKRLHTFANRLESTGHVALANELDAIIRDTPPESGGQGEANGSDPNQTDHRRCMKCGFVVDVSLGYCKPGTDAACPAHPPAQASGAVTEAMVTCAEDFYYDNAPFNGPGELREGIRTMLATALTQGGGNEH